MNLPFGAAFVATNEKLKSAMGLGSASRTTEQAKAELPRYFLAAGFAGAVSSALTQPLDVVKTRLQTQDCACGVPLACEKTGTAPVVKYENISSSVRLILREEGAAGFMKGLLPRVVTVAPSAAVCWGTYETVKTFLGLSAL
mmetsp:Transcript_53393/g.122169  ORF Transcript_53393/g.122169 Transcript_53393/m.122169 type:complete len:142 (+) Transcript_53393:106-531(+)